MDDTCNSTASPPTRSKIYNCSRGDFLVRLSGDRCWWACINGRAYPLATVQGWWNWDPELPDHYQLVLVAEVSDAEAIAYAKRGGPYNPPAYAKVELATCTDPAIAEALGYPSLPVPQSDRDAQMIQRLESGLAEVRQHLRDSLAAASEARRLDAEAGAHALKEERRLHHRAAGRARRKMVETQRQADEMRAAHARELAALRSELRDTQERLGRKEALIAQMRDLLPGRI